MDQRGHKALYRKYRPQSLSDLVGQPQVTDILKAALKKQMIGHAYLFSGPRGTGKTSAARILAHEFNQIPYSENLNLDIIEIDAASNRRIEDIRDLREVIKLAPTKLKYKVYIIDEVHMLTNESFNALLKTLEEPPAHAIFILATTDLHKVPATILSRTQKFSFRLLGSEQLAEHLNKIADAEKIKTTPAALSLIAELSGGSVRDAISILDQLHALGGEINEEFVRDVMGMPSAALEANTLKALQGFDSGTLLSLVGQMLENGSDAREIIKSFISLSAQLKNLTNLHLNLIDDLASALTAYNPDLFLRIALVKFNPNIPQVELSEPTFVSPSLTDYRQSRPRLAGADKDQTKKTQSEELGLNDEPEPDLTPNLHAPNKQVRGSAPLAGEGSSPTEKSKLNNESEQTTSTVHPKPPLSERQLGQVDSGSNQKDNSEVIQQETPSLIEEAQDEVIKGSKQFKFSNIAWIKVLEEVKIKSSLTFAALRLAKPEYKNGILNLTFKFDFHKKKLDEAKNKKILLDALRLVLGSEPDLKYNINKEVELDGPKLGDSTEVLNQAQASDKNQESILSKVNDIMGGGEVVER